MIVPLVFLFSLILVLKTGSRGLINVGDSLFPFFPQEAFRRLLYLWDPHNVLGRDTSATVSQLPWYGLAALLERLGAPLWLINRLWFVLPFLLLGLSMYFLSGVIFGKENKAPRFVATLFFMFNPFTLGLVGGSTILTLSFTAGVFVFGFFVRGLAPQLLADEKVWGWREVFFLGLASIFMPANLVVWVMMLLLCAAYLLFFVLVNRHNRPHLRHAFLNSLFFILYSSLANAWWLLPLVYQFTSSEYFGTLFASGTDVGTFDFVSQFTSLFDVSRLFYGMTPTANFPISHYYHYLLAPTMMSVILLAVYAIACLTRKSKFEIFFLLLAWISVILASGTRPPFGFVYQFLWDHLPYFHIFRTTNRFNLYTMISYAILLGFFYQHLKEFLEEHRRRSLILYSLFFILVSIFLSAWPLLSGDLYEQLKPHQIPQDYYDLREFLKNQEGDFRVMNFPLTTWSVPYSWSAPFDMQEILIDFSPKDVIVNGSGYLQDLKEREVSENDPVYALVYKHLERNEAIEILKMMGVRYLVVHHDYVIVHGQYFPVDVSEVTNTLQKADGISFVRAFGDLDVYEVSDFRPRVYALVEGQTRRSGLTLDYQKISPVEYKVSVTGAEEPYTLVLAENFHPGWESSVGEPVRFGEFANGWEIDQTGDYEIILKYRPQKLFDVGMAISILSLVTGFGILVYCRVRGVRRLMVENR